MTQILCKSALLVVVAGVLLAVAGLGCKKLEERLVSDNPEVRIKAMSQVSELSPDEQNQLISTLEAKVLSVGSVSSRLFAVDALKGIGEPALASIIKVCLTPNLEPDLHKAAVDSFVAVGVIGSQPEKLVLLGPDAMGVLTMVFDDSGNSVDVLEKVGVRLAAFGSSSIPTFVKRALHFEGETSELALIRLIELAHANASSFNMAITPIVDDVLTFDETRFQKSFEVLNSFGDTAVTALIDAAMLKGTDSVEKLQKLLANSSDVFLQKMLAMMLDATHRDFAVETVVLMGSQAIPLIKTALVDALSSDPGENSPYTKNLHKLLAKRFGKNGRKALVEIMVETQTGAGSIIAYGMVKSQLAQCQEMCVRQQNRGGTTINGVPAGAYVCNSIFDRMIGQSVNIARNGKHKMMYQNGFITPTQYDAIIMAHVNGLKAQLNYLCNGVQSIPDIAWKLFLMN